MSVFSKLKLYSRKPATVILAAALATSSVPVQALVQATPAYAAQESKAGRPDKSNNSTKTTWDDLSVAISLKFDSHTSLGEDGSAEATVSKDAILNLVKQQQWAKDLLAYTEGGTNEFSQAVDQNIADINSKLAEDEKATDPTGMPEVGEGGSQTTVEVSPIEIRDLSAELTDVTVDEGSIKASDDGLKVKVNRDGSWTVTADEAVTSATITFSVTDVAYRYKFAYDYTVTTNTTTISQTGDGTNPDEVEPVTVTSPEDKSGVFPGPKAEDYKTDNKIELTAPQSVTTAGVTVTDAWSGADISIDGLFPVVSGLQYNHGGMGAVEASQALACLPGLEYKVTYAEGDEYYFEAEVQYDWGRGQYVFYVTPKHATTEAKTFTVQFYFWGGDIEVGNPVEVTVSPIARETIDLSQIQTGEALDFRMADDQADYIQAAANAAVSDATGGLINDLYTDAEIVNLDKYYAADGQPLAGSGDVALTSRAVDGADDALNDFNLTGQPSISMKAMESESWSEPQNADLAQRLSVTGDTLGKTETLTSPSIDPDGGVWFRNDATVAWNGGTIVQATTATPSAATTFGDGAVLAHSAQGTQEGSFFVRDDEDGIVRRIDGVKYLYDDVAPALTAFDAVPSGRDFKSSDRNIWAAESMDVQFWTSEGAANTAASGINRVDASYTQQGSSEAEQPKSLQDMRPTDEASGGGYKYEFSIDADSKVSTDSISVDLQDKAGNESNGLGYDDTVTNIDVANLVAQTTAPTISASWDTTAAHNGSCYNTNRTLTLTVHAPFFEYTQQYLGNHAMATITKDGAGWKTVTPGDFTKTGDDTWVCTISFTEDGDYEVSNVNATDVLSRTSTAAGDTFTIDKTAPTMQVTFDNNSAANGNYYNAARTATITITEHNFDPSLVNITPTASAGNGGEVGQPSISGWSSSGDVHTATVTFPGQGVYTLSVDGMDLATNALTPYTCPEFVVDTIDPEITISGVENMTAYADAVSPSVAVHDTNLDSSTDIHVDVVGTSPYGENANPFSDAASMTATDAAVDWGNPLDVKANDNVYTVVVRAVDLAGNTSDDAVTFSVNRFGSTYVISSETGEMLDQYLQHDDTTDVRVTEINPSGLDAAQTSVELTRDTTNTTLTADEYSVEAGSPSGWQEYTYTVGRDNYDADGVYRVLFHSQDVAGNVSENVMEDKNRDEEGAAAEVNFAVDDTAPLASFADLSNAEPYNESSHTAKVTFEDNLLLDHAVVEIDGKEVATFDADQLASSATQEFTIGESTGNQSIVVSVWDAAGNKGEASMDDVVVTTNAFELWRRNTPLFAGTIAVAVLAVAGIIFGVYRKSKKDEDATA